MSSATLPGDGRESSMTNGQLTESVDRALERTGTKVVSMLASIKLTCVLFVLTLIIVFIGSLAQSRSGINLVMRQYFRTYVAWVDVEALFPPSFFGPTALALEVDDFGILVAEKFESLFGSRRFPLPGGWTIGWLMLANLIAAHSLKFRLTASGRKLLAGVGLVVLAIVMITVVVITGNRQKGVAFAENAIVGEGTVWGLMLLLLGLTGTASIAAAVLQKSLAVSVRSLLGVIGAVFLSLLLYYLIGGEAARLESWSLRILWQLLKGTACSLVLLLGANLLFGKRGGIAVIHVGVALLMIGELWVGLMAKENMLQLTEGASSNFVRDAREYELAIEFPKDDMKEHVVAIPDVELMRAAPKDAASTDPELAKPRNPIRRDSLPFDIQVRSYFVNSTLRGRRPGDEKLSDRGLASFTMADPMPPVNGMDNTNDQPAAVIDLLDKSSGRVIETLLVAQEVSELRGQVYADTVTVDGREYRFTLRWQRNYRDYDVKLIDVDRTLYVGSSTPKDFRSQIEITDRRTDTTEKFTVWMNNPLRYQGETFYQTGYEALSDGREVTTLSVVNNEGWMLPYIACMVAAFGMFAQFGATLSRFLSREERKSLTSDGASDNSQSRPGFGPARRAARVTESVEPGSWISRFGVPALVVCVFAGWMGSSVRTPKVSERAFDLNGFASLPVAWSGRAQPIDSMARTQLLMASHKTTFEGELEAAELGDAARREKIIAEFSKGWPSANAEELKSFNGSYEEWVSKMSELTSSGVPAIESRMRPLMTVRMPAIRWLLDVITRPEIAGRHRVIKIDNDTILSSLGLEKRAGLTYSMAEILPSIRELDPLLQSARAKRADGKTALLTAEERRALSLGNTLTRINDLRQLFEVQRSDGLLEACVDSWRVLLLLGESPAVNAVPTGSSDEQRSWETVVGAQAVLSLNRELDAAGIETLDQLKAYLRDVLPGKLVHESIVGSWQVLATLPASSDSATETLSVPQRAAESLSRIDDAYLRRVLEVIAAADPQARPDDVAASVTPEQAREITSERYQAALFEVFETIRSQNAEDPRLLAIRTRLQQLGSDDTATLSAAMTDELLTLTWTDLQARVGELLPGGASRATFTKSATLVTDILAAWKSGDVKSFNTNLVAYQSLLASGALPDFNASLISKEAWFHRVEPFYKAICLYLPVLALSFIGWLAWGSALRRVSLSLLVFGFVVHTLALYWRMEFSGLPPVTNLYSSAIFIGWAAIIAAFVIELMLKNGVGNLLGASIGAASLMIAHYLAREEFSSLEGGDNLGVMQAVLDTTFWLATHVVCITLGYSATFLAGFIGMLYCVQALRGRAFGSRTTESSAADLKMFGKLTYGTLCFAIFFSLVGTVLGGLWADDSWGRFWGWDPKENGALMIVIWNALVLHARWDKMVGDYGTGVLAMIGNVVTAWSWFGVNGLGAGLHTYGFTEGRMLALLLFVVAQMLIVIGFAATARLARARSLAA